MKWAHDDLAIDLARHLTAESRMIWTDMQLGPQGSPRPDVYTIERSYVRPNPTAYEVKISVSDFRADVTVGKWSSYQRYAHAVVFACPAGLIGKGDVPDACGLILRHENGWRYAKRPTVNPHPIEQAALLKLLIDGVTREGPPIRAKQWKDRYNSFAKKFGETAARYVVEATTVHGEIESARKYAASIIEQARRDADRHRANLEGQSPELWTRLINVLGLQPDTNTWEVGRAINAIRAQTEGTAAERLVKQIEASIRAYNEVKGTI